MKVLGIDGATKKTGVALVENGKVVDRCLINFSKQKDSDLRLNQMGKEIILAINWTKPDYVYFQDNWVENNPKKIINPKVSKMLTTLLGQVRGYCFLYDINFRTIYPSSWRKEIGIKAQERLQAKQEAIEYVKKNYGFNDVNDDVAEAICIALAGYKKEIENVNR